MAGPIHRDPAPLTIPTVRAFFAGNSGSGKTFRAWQFYLSRFPRRLVIDQTGEWRSAVDGTADSVGACVDTVRRLAATRSDWSVAYSDADDGFRELVHWLIPVPDLHRSPVIMLGGAVLFVDEVDLIAPFGPPPEHIRTLYRRSRHVGLSVISATQVPANVSKEVSRQSQHKIALFLSEPSDVAYMAEAMRWDPPAVTRWLDWCRLHPHGAVWKDVQSGDCLFFPESGAPSLAQQLLGGR